MALYIGVVGKLFLVVLAFAVLVYVTLRLLQKRRARKANGGRRPAAPKPFVAPDDDPNFLRDIERRRRRERGKQPKPDKGDPGKGSTEPDDGPDDPPTAGDPAPR